MSTEEETQAEPATGSERLAAQLQERFGDDLQSCVCAHAEVTVEVAAEQLSSVARALFDEDGFAFRQLTDLCGVDYLEYGVSEWVTENASTTGFGRGVEVDATVSGRRHPARFAVVYHLLSIANNRRLRLRTWVDEDRMIVDSVVDIWPGANWFEREAFDLFGILFNGHPDLRRILTDYGFIGHPFRKDFPLIGNVEVRYDAEKQRVIYEPVSIEPRVLVPRVIRTEEHPDA